MTESGPFEESQPGPEAADAREHSSSEAKLPAAQCSHVQELALAITASDIAAAQESAMVDTAACMLEATCGEESRQVFRVQRQTPSGAGRVVELIRAL